MTSPTTDEPAEASDAAADTGAADPALAAVLSAYATGGAGDAAVFAAVAAARLLVPVVAQPSDDGPVEMALPVMVGTDGRRALPVFTSVASLAAWDPAARPVPVDARRAAAGALQEACAFLVVDPAGPVTWVADRRQVEQLAGESA